MLNILKKLKICCMLLNSKSFECKFCGVFVLEGFEYKIKILIERLLFFIFLYIL